MKVKSCGHYAPSRTSWPRIPAKFNFPEPFLAKPSSLSRGNLLRPRPQISNSFPSGWPYLEEVDAHQE